MKIRNIAIGISTIACLALIIGCQTGQKSGATRAEPSTGMDWPFWRGPSGTGVSDEKGLVNSWSPEGENLIWKAEYTCRSTPAVFRGRLYFIGGVGDGARSQEGVTCLDANTGRIVWQDRFNVFLVNVQQSRVGWADICVDPETGNVYAHGVGGVFRCYSRDGKILWSRSMTEEFGRLSGYGGRTNSPIVEGDMILMGFTCSSWGPYNLPSHRYWSFDKHTGEVIYISSPAGKFKNSTYSTPVVGTVNGMRVLFDGNSDGSIYAIKANTGEKLWGTLFTEKDLQASVVYSEGKVYACHGRENINGETRMGAVCCLDAETGKVLWKSVGHEVGSASPCVKGNDLFVIENDSDLVCLDTATGSQKWEQRLGTVGKGSPVWVDGKVIATEVNGRVHIIEYGPDGVKNHHSVQLMLTSGGIKRPSEIYGSPAISNGRIFITSEDKIYCIGKKGSGVISTDFKPMKGARTIGTGAPTFLQVVPGETCIIAGHTQQFKARAFDASGYLIGEVKPTWVAGKLAGNLADGVFTPSEPQAGMLVAKLGELTGAARVRVAPGDSLKEDFTASPPGKSPSYFVGAGKFETVKQGENTVLFKPADSPGLKRSFAFVGDPGMKNYTIEMEVMVKEYKRRMPDAGVINGRYIFDLMGNHQKVQFRTWPGSSPPRFQVDQRFRWDPDVWYKIKFRAELPKKEGEPAKLFGKVWKKSEQEPAAWTIEATDECGNNEGAPGIHGYSDVDIFYDNLSVTPNN